MIQRLIIPLDDHQPVSLSSSRFLPAHTTAAYKLLYQEIKKWEEIQLTWHGKLVGKLKPQSETCLN